MASMSGAARGLFRVDGSEGLVASGNKVELQGKAKQSTKFNALWKEGTGLTQRNPGPVCYEVKVAQGEGVWAGWTQESKFGAGWKCKSLSFGGNLSDGGGLMRGDFGPSLNAGSQLLMRAEIVNDVLEIHLATNSGPLGQAFSVSVPNPCEPFFPVISFSDGPSAAVIELQQQCPPCSAFLRNTAAGRDSVFGEWALNAQDIPASAPQGSEVIFKVGGTSLAAHVEGANRKTRGIHPQPPYAPQGPVISTRMMPPEELRQVDMAVEALLQNYTGMRLSPSRDSLLLTSSSKEYKLRPHQTKLPPVEAHELSWSP